MWIFIFIAILSGMLNIINKMVNIQAKRHLGMSNGTLVNYLEGTVISLIILFIIGKGMELSPEGISSIQPIFFIGGVAGLFSMIFSIKGMENTGIVFSTVVMLIGQLGIAFIIDTITSQNINSLKLLGIVLIILGIGVNKYFANKKEIESV